MAGLNRIVTVIVDQTGSKRIPARQQLTARRSAKGVA